MSVPCHRAGGGYKPRTSNTSPRLLMLQTLAATWPVPWYRCSTGVRVSTHLLTDFFCDSGKNCKKSVGCPVAQCDWNEITVFRYATPYSLVHRRNVQSRSSRYRMSLTSKLNIFKQNFSGHKNNKQSNGQFGVALTFQTRIRKFPIRTSTGPMHILTCFSSLSTVPPGKQ